MEHRLASRHESACRGRRFTSVGVPIQVREEAAHDLNPKPMTALELVRRQRGAQDDLDRLLRRHPGRVRFARTVPRAEDLQRRAHEVPGRAVRLDVWWVQRFSGRAEAREGQKLRWCDAAALSAAAMLPADAPLVARVIAELGNNPN